MSRAQANLLSVVVAVTLLSTTLVVGVAVTDAAFETASHDASGEATAVAVSDRLVERESPLTSRENVIDATAAEAVDEDALVDAVPRIGALATRVVLDGELLVETGDPGDGHTVTRTVLVERPSERTYEPSLEETGEVTLPRRTDRVDVTIDPPPETTVETVRIGERVVLHDPDGLDGEYRVPTSRYETATVRLDADGELPAGTVTLTARVTETERALLEVTVDG